MEITFKKNLFLWNQHSDDLQTWYTASRTWALQSYSNSDSGLTLAYFTARSALLPNAFVWENATNGTNSWLSEYINTCEYKRSLFDLCPRTLRFVISNDMGHKTKMEPCPYMAKSLKHFLSENKWRQCWLLGDLRYLFCREKRQIYSQGKTWKLD